MSSFFKKIAAFFLFCFSSLSGQDSTEELVYQGKIEDEIPCQGKVDVGPAYVHVDLLKSGVTRHRIDLAAIRADASYLFWKYLILKPSFLYGENQHRHHKDTLSNFGVGLGAYIPLAKKLIVTPSFGVTFGNLKTHYKVHNPLLPAPLNVTEKFHSSSPYIAIELSYTFRPSCRILLFYQYAWSHTRTTIKPLLKEKSHSEGSNYSALLEYDINPHWSLNVGAAYNMSLTKEKHGLRAYGYKLGVAYWF